MTVSRLILACVFLSTLWASPHLQAADQPNFIFLLADDLGYNGLACYGSDFHETPNLDGLAQQGIRFTDAYAACTVCSPTRAAAMSGKYPARLHLTDWISGQHRPFAKLRIPDWTQHLPLQEVTVAGALRAAGYATAHIGKWHLGGPQFFPEKQGFDLNIGGNAKGSPPGGYFLPNKLDLPGAKQGDYLTDRLTDEAIGVIERFRDRPFFLYFPYYTVHTPIQGRPDLVEKFSGKVRPDALHQNPEYAAMVHNLDQSVGRILETLERLELADNTYLIFTSDNGGLSQRFDQPTGITDNAPLRRGKGSAYEGGVRVPLIVRGPGVAVGKECDEPVITIDYYPTLLAAAGAPGDPAHNRNVDGVSLLPLLRDPAQSLEREAIYWHYPHYHAGGDEPYGAVRAGDWRLVEFYDNGAVELYNLREDLGETKNLAAAEPERARQLTEMLHAWRKSVDAQMPTPNPNYDPAKSAQAGGSRRKP